MAARIAASDRHAWLIARRGEQALGYAYGARLHARAAYRWACLEVSVYVARDACSAGVGSALYAAPFERLVERGYVTAIAGLTLPNPASRALHAEFGFTDIGNLIGRAGFKLGAGTTRSTSSATSRPRSPGARRAALEDRFGDPHAYSGAMSAPARTAACSAATTAGSSWVPEATHSSARASAGQRRSR